MKIIIMMSLTIFLSTKSELRGQESRYETLFEIFEKGIPESRLDFEVGISFDGTWGSLPLSRLSYWASIMKPKNKNEMRIAILYTESKIPEARMIAAWSILNVFGFKRSDYPSDISPTWIGQDEDSLKYNKFINFFRNILKEKNAMAFFDSQLQGDNHTFPEK